MKLCIDKDITFRLSNESIDFISTLKEMSVYHRVSSDVCTVSIQKITLDEEDMTELFEECFGDLTFTYANLGDQFSMRVTK